ncbi:MAG: YafY family transcriptional regulator [Deltaproteobacteria bacterium]|nr:YafY family transcriptional regulator [Candidatus Anaeroferrophillus wilburensis]MBN2889998.1 YafY family transcriptional regulator [Deltaproteobacteria bacterium]
MDRTERFYKIDLLLKEKTSVPLSRFMEELEVSRSTVKRDLEYLRDRLNAPIIWDRSMSGYRYGMPQAGMPQYVLPGLWFNESELHALLSMESLLTNLQPGLLGSHLDPLKQRLRKLLGSGGHPAGEVAKRIKVSHLAARPVPKNHFPVIMTALLDRRQLHIHHYNRGTDQTLSRTISPQRLVYYRDNWYLDAWCHLRDDLRCFAMDVINNITPLPEIAKEIPEDTLNQEFTTTYGIFAGCQTTDAVLRFSPACARWVAREEWHPDQQGSIDQEGCYLLCLPYSHDTELLMDILRYGPEVEVLEPESLREKVKERLELTLKNYKK